jgi:hypothetical protein
MMWLGQPLMLPLAGPPLPSCSCNPCRFCMAAAVPSCPAVKLQLLRGVSVVECPAGDDTLRTIPGICSSAALPLLLPAVNDPQGLPKPRLPVAMRPPGAGELLLLCCSARLCIAAIFARSLRATAPIERCVQS